MGFFSNLTGNGKGLSFSDSLKYVSDYKTETVTDDKGRERKRARYIGPWYVITTEPGPSRARMIAALALGVIAAALHVFMLLHTHYGMGEYPVLIPTLFALFPLMYMLMGLVSLPFGLKPMHRDRHQHSFMRASKSGVAVALMQGVSFIAVFIYRFAEGDLWFRPEDWVYIGAMVLEAACIIVMIRLLYNVEREEKPNSHYDEGLLK
ncbi:MAG: hypothetical protein IKQ36_07145 [Clostridia bacterium]|nr:hypothetical protein [Clostridia bacterium]